MDYFAFNDRATCIDLCFPPLLPTFVFVKILGHHIHQISSRANQQQRQPAAAPTSSSANQQQSQPAAAPTSSSANQQQSQPAAEPTSSRANQQQSQPAAEPTSSSLPARICTCTKQVPIASSESSEFSYDTPVLIRKHTRVPISLSNLVF